ncbi:MAG: hypothetical protein WC238_04420 [Parcubacteria group bacterium]|jgi:hypothetical protein
MKQKKINKILFSFITIGGLLVLNIYPALAVRIPSANEMARDLEKRYHVTTDSIKNAGESFNTGANKSQAPQVSLNFDPTNPRSGEKITATAYPMYFNNDPKNLYYTWYLKHTGLTDSCPAGVASDFDGNCDWNGDSQVNVEDWKIEAARMIANNGFDWNRALGANSPYCNIAGNIPDYCNQVDQYSAIAQADQNSGYRAKPGGDDRPTNSDLDEDDLTPHCYIHDFESGIDYELVEEVPDQGILCSSGKTAVCTKTNTDIVFDPDGNSANDTCEAVSDAPICSIKDSETASFSCSAIDEIPLCVDTDNIDDDDVIFSEVAISTPTTVPTGTPSVTDGLMEAGDYYYVITAIIGAEETPSSPQSALIAVTGSTGSVQLNWADVPGATAYKVYRTTTSGTYTNSLIAAGDCDDPTESTCLDSALAVSTGTPPTASPTVLVSDSCENIDDNADISLGNSSNLLTVSTPWKIDSDLPATAANPIEDVSCSADTVNDDVAFICSDKDKQHLFAYPPTSFDGETFSRKKSGDDAFSVSEELFWHTDPQSASTAQNGNKDEANVVGLGQTTFTWTYQTGDQIGVAVEGVSATPTKYDDASLMIMWALPKNKCDIEKTGFYTQEIKGYDVKMPVTTITDNDNGQNSCIGGNCLNDCLKDNLIDPQGDQNSLNVSLSYSPENPINDPTENNTGDEVSVSAAITNAQSPGFVKYQWEVYGGNSVSPANGWGSPLLKSDIPEAKQTSGIGLSTFRFKMNFPGSFAAANKYLRVRVTASEGNNSGTSDVIIPLTSTAAKIHVFSTDATDNNGDLGVQNIPSKERCNEGLDNVLCPVVKNEIVGLQTDSPLGDALTNILWTIDGQPLQPIGENCVSGDCIAGSGEATGIAYFPVLKDNDDQYSVNLSATTGSGEKINLTKTFKVTDPSLTIISADENTCKAELLGSYTDLDGIKWPDYSETSFQGVTAATITLKPKLNMPFIQNPQWFIDGVEATSLGAAVDQATNTLSFTANKQPGESYSITMGGIYAQKPSIKKILNSYFDVQLNEFYEKPIGASIELTMVDSLTGDASAQAPLGRKILASLVTDVPAYISFLFRIVLTTILILFTSSILLVLSPKREN